MVLQNDLFHFILYIRPNKTLGIIIFTLVFVKQYDIPSHTFQHLADTNKVTVLRKLIEISNPGAPQFSLFAQVMSVNLI